MDGIKHRIVPASRLVRVAGLDDLPGNRESLSIGDVVMLNSGSPEMMVVDFQRDMVIVAAEDGEECAFPRPCLSLVRTASGTFASEGSTSPFV